MHGRRRYIIVFLTVAFLSTLYLVTDFESVPDADATGGAFKDTKHGGGTVDGFPHVGIDRSVNPDHFPFYSGSTDAGQYNPGECVHCHEPHSSFGGSEQLPNSPAGPDSYLLFQDNDNNLCWYCHENINFDPFYGGGVGAWRFYQGQLIYEGSSHGNSANPVEWPGGLTVPTIFPRNYDRTSGVNKNDCVNCHTPHGIKGASGSEYDTGAVPVSPTNRQLAANNVDVGTDYLIPRQLIAWEEVLCLQCHDGTPASNISAQLGKTSNHPVDDTTLAGRHTTREYMDVTNSGQIDYGLGSGTQYWNSVSANTRHVECVDCHNPHAAQAIPSDPNRDTDGGAAGRNTEMIRLRGPLLGGWGAKPTGTDGTWGGGHTGWPTPSSYTNDPNPTDGNATSYTKLFFDNDTDDDMYEAYLCLKCHSYFAWGTDGFGSVTTGSHTYNQTDVTRDFNPQNFGYHPVFNRGQNRPTGSGNPNFDSAFVGTRGIYHDSYITCTDCHASDIEGEPRGPHGSANNWILRSNEVGVTTAVFCHNCHTPQTYGDNTTDGGSTFGTDMWSRVQHPPDQGNRADPAVDTPLPPLPPISCMNCHGGSRLGGIHGSNEPPGDAGDQVNSVTNRGYRLINGVKWMGWNETGSGPACQFGTTDGTMTGYVAPNSGFSTDCTHGGDGGPAESWEYTYSPTHYDP